MSKYVDVERRHAYLLAYAEANREKAAERSRAWYAANKERAKETRRAYHASHQAEHVARSDAWNKAHPENKRKAVLNRRARIAGVFVETVDPARVFERDNGICQICDEAIGDQKWHVDHRIPISRGGEHSYANVQLAHARCNQRKWAKT